MQVPDRGGGEGRAEMAGPATVKRLVFEADLETGVQTPALAEDKVHGLVGGDAGNKRAPQRNLHGFLMVLGGGGTR